eukprot:GHUV01051445.1.p1 GENE.GHUV01051445.1~~GHUV01051445.1.p1  ORF type:complete len:199 (+),score=29.72 GHUV01051445.1:672-1268(+)
MAFGYCCSVLKGDQHIAATAKGLLDEEEEVPINYGWSPFNGPNGQSLLGQVDLAFLAAYAAGMFTVGHWGDRTDLRIFLAVGILGSGISCTLFGMVSRRVSFAHLGCSQGWFQLRAQSIPLEAQEDSIVRQCLAVLLNTCSVCDWSALTSGPSAASTGSQVVSDTPSLASCVAGLPLGPPQHVVLYMDNGEKPRHWDQ